MKSKWSFTFWIIFLGGLSGCATDYPSLSKESFAEQPARVLLKTPYIEAEYDKKRVEESNSRARGSASVGDVIVLSLSVLAITGGRYTAIPLNSGGDRELDYPARFIYKIKTQDEKAMNLLEAYDGFNVALAKLIKESRYKNSFNHLASLDARLHQDLAALNWTFDK